ncbi:MAG: CBS domain-containing protein [Pirellulales bacterium]
MDPTIERLLTLRVADLMNKQVVHVSASHSMADAAEIFVKREISGAPVIDAGGRCVGVLSAFDFVRRERLRGPIGEGRPRDEADQKPSQLVDAYMTAPARSLTPNMSLLNAARMMCDEHVHRLPVLDDRGQVIGIVSAMDLVATLVQAIEE